MGTAFDELEFFRAITRSGARASSWESRPRRQTVAFSADVSVALLTLDDLIATKRFAARPHDAEDVRLLEALRSRERA